MDLQDKTALVTGGAHRVGRAIALALAEAGCDLIIHYNASEQAALETQKMIAKIGRRASIIGADLCDLDQLRSMFEKILAEYHRINVLVNSAAIMESVPFDQVDDAAWSRSHTRPR